MFSALFEKASDLLGKPLLVVTFFPTLFATAGLLLTIAPTRLDELIKTWAESAPTEQITAGIATILAIYTIAFVLYGLREPVSNIVAGGRFWVLPSLIRSRRHYFVDWRARTAGTIDDSYIIADATVWAERGFPLDKRDIIRKQTDRVAPTIEADLIRIRERLRRIGDRRLLRAQLDARGQRLIQRALLLLLEYFSSTTDNGATQREIDRFRMACSRAAPGIDVVAWYRQAQLYLYQDVVVAGGALQQFPPTQFVQPTLLGNVLGWAGVSTLARYGIELAALFPRLLKVIETEYAARIDEARQYHEFALMMNLLCSFNAVVVFAAGSWGSTYYACTTSFPWTVRTAPLVIRCARAELAFAFWSALWLALAMAFYFVAVSTGRAYATLLTSAVDLYRRKLLDQMDVTAITPTDERAAWEALNSAVAEPTSIAPPTGASLMRIEPGTLARGKAVKVYAIGANLAGATILKIAKDASEILASDVTSVASVVHGTLTIPADAASGSWDVIVDLSDGTTLKTAAALEVT